MPKDETPLSAAPKAHFTANIPISNREGEKQEEEDADDNEEEEEGNKTVRLRDLIINALQNKRYQELEQLMKEFPQKVTRKLSQLLTDEKLVRLILDGNLPSIRDFISLDVIFAVALSEAIPALRLLLGARRLEIEDEVRLLHDATMRCCSSTVRFLLSRGQFPVDKFRSDNPLAAAAKRGATTEALLLLDHGYDVGIGYTEKLSPLYLSARHGQLSIMRILKDRGAAACRGAPSKATLLREALKFGHHCIVDFIMDWGISLERDAVSLEAAVLGGNVRLSRFILEQKDGSRELERSQLYGSLLQAAAAKGHLEMAHLLADHGAVIDRFRKHLVLGGNGPFMAAVSSGNGELVSWFIERGASMYRASGYYGNALQTAVILGHTDVVQVLLDNGFDPNTKESEFGSALWIATNRIPSGFRKDVICGMLEGCGAKSDPATFNRWNKSSPRPRQLGTGYSRSSWEIIDEPRASP